MYDQLFVTKWLLYSSAYIGQKPVYNFDPI